MSLDAALPPATLQGVTVIELEGLGPAPFAGMMLGDLGADVIRVRKPGRQAPAFLPEAGASAIDRSRCGTIELDLKSAKGRDALLALVEASDILVEGFRPGVMEKLGLGPETCLQRQPRLVYGRMTGWGQTGPWAARAGHDINYIATTGALHAIGRPGSPPVAPLSLLGDYGGGAMFLLVGVLAALTSARTTGRGRVIDAAIVDGVSLLMASVWGRMSTGQWKDERGVNLLDGGAPFYDVYATADAAYMAVGSLEPHFFDRLCQALGLYPKWSAANQMDPGGWERMRSDFAAAFKTRTRQDWTDTFADTDACVSPVLSLREAASNEQMKARQVLQVDGQRITPSEAPRSGQQRVGRGLDAVLDGLELAPEVRDVLLGREPLR